MPDSEDESDSNGVPGADPLVGTWNLEMIDDYAYPYTYSYADGCEVIVSGLITFGSTLRYHYEYGSGCSADHEDYDEDEAVEAVAAGAGGYEIAVDDPDGGAGYYLRCTIEGSRLTCIDEGREGEEDSTLLFEGA